MATPVFAPTTAATTSADIVVTENTTILLTSTTAQYGYPESSDNPIVWVEMETSGDSTYVKIGYLSFRHPAWVFVGEGSLRFVKGATTAPLGVDIS